MMPQYSSGMVTSNPTNPTDEIPIGPQVFPYGTPMTSESQVEPYLSTNYSNFNMGGATSSSLDAFPTTNSLMYQNEQYNTPVETSLTGAYPATNYQNGTSYQTGDLGYGTYGSTTTNVGTYDLGAFQTSEYQINDYGTPSFQSVSVPTYQSTSGFKTVVRYKPVTKTIMVPQIVTNYVPVSINSGVQGSIIPGSEINPMVPTPNPITQQPLFQSKTAPLPAPVQAPAMPISLPTPPTAPVPAPMPNYTGGHFVSNYPIYENDPKRSTILNSIAINPLNSLNASTATLATSVPIGGNLAGNQLINPAAAGLANVPLNTSITGVNPQLAGLNTGLNNVNAGINSLNAGLNTGLNAGLNTGLNNLNTGINNLNSGLNAGISNLNSGLNANTNNLGGLGSGLNQVGTGLSALGSGLGNTVGNGLNTLGTGVNNIGNGLNTVNNLTSGVNNLTSGANTGISNLAGGINSAANNLTTGVDNLRTGLTNNLTSSATGAANNLTDSVTGAANNVLNTADNLRSGVTSGLNTGLNNASSGLDSLVGKVGEAATSTQEGISNVASGIKNAFK